MTALQTFILCSQAWFLGIAIMWTLAYINRVMVFMGNVINKKDAEIPARHVYYVAISWAIFFWLMKAQF